MATIRSLAYAFSAVAVALLGAGAPSSDPQLANTGKYSWPERLRIQFRPTASQEASIDKARRSGAKSVAVDLTGDQAAWVKQNYGFSVPSTTVRWRRPLPEGFKVVISPKLRYEFQPFYSMECTSSGSPQCVTDRLPLQVEVGSNGSRPSPTLMNRLMVAPVLALDQRQSIERLRRAGMSHAMVVLTAAERKVLSALTPRFAQRKMNVEFMAAPEPARIVKQRVLAADGCTMEWTVWCDKYGCHELCVPKCD